MVYYENCCFCMKSKTGAKVIAILGIVFNSLALIAGSIAYGVFYDDLYNLASFEESLGPPGFNFESLKTINILVGVCITVFVLWIAFCYLFLHGIEKRRHIFMLPFLIFKMIVIVVSISQNCPL